MDIRVIGAGAWGTALAINAARHGHVVTLWARDAQQAMDMAERRENLRYLPGHGFPPTLAVSQAALDGVRRLVGDKVVHASGVQQG